MSIDMRLSLGKLNPPNTSWNSITGSLIMQLHDLPKSKTCIEVIVNRILWYEHYLSLIFFWIVMLISVATGVAYLSTLYKTIEARSISDLHRYLSIGNLITPYIWGIGIATWIFYWYVHTSKYL